MWIEIQHIASSVLLSILRGSSRCDQTKGYTCSRQHRRSMNWTGLDWTRSSSLLKVDDLVAAWAISYTSIGASELVALVHAEIRIMV